MAALCDLSPLLFVFNSAQRLRSEFVNPLLCYGTVKRRSLSQGADGELWPRSSGIPEIGKAEPGGSVHRSSCPPWSWGFFQFVLEQSEQPSKLCSPKFGYGEKITRYLRIYPTFSNSVLFTHLLAR